MSDEFKLLIFFCLFLLIIFSLMGYLTYDSYKLNNFCESKNMVLLDINNNLIECALTDNEGNMIKKYYKRNDMT